MPVFKLRVTKTHEEECTFLVRMPNKRYLNGSTEDSLAALDYANEEGEWDEVEDDHHISINDPTEKDLETMEVSSYCVFGGTEDEITPALKSEEPIDPRQLPLKITT